MPTMPPPMRVGVAVGLVSAVFAGCGGAGTTTSDDSGGASPAPSSASPSVTATSDAPAATPSDAPSVAPATGPLLDIEGLTLNLPDGWTLSPGDLSAAATDPGLTGGQILAQAVSAIQGVDTVDSLAEQAIETARSEGYAPTREADREVAGAEGYVLRGADETFPTWFEFGAIGTNGYVAIIVVRFNQELPATETDAIIDSILASVTYPPA